MSSHVPFLRQRPGRGVAHDGGRPAVATVGSGRRGRRASLVAGWFVAATCGLLLLGFQGDRMYADTLMNLYSGRYIWQHGLPHTDPFTVAGAGRPWIDGQWLANLVFYGAWRLGGLWLVGKLSVASLVGGFVLLSRYLRWRGASFGVQALAPVLALAASLPALFPRSQNLVVPLFVALIWLVMDADRADRRSTRRTVASVAALVGLLVLWGNLHGSSAMAVGLTFAYALYRSAGLLRASGRRAGRELAAWVSLLLAAPATMLLTPYGVDTFEQYRAVLGNSAFHRYTSEWAPAWQVVGLALAGPALILLGVATVAAIRRRAPICVPLAACVAVLALATVVEARYSLWLAIAAVAMFGEAGTRTRPRETVSSLVVLGSAAAALVWTFALGTQLVGSGDARALDLMPRATVQAAFLEATTDPHARVLGDLDGSALMLWLHPELRGRVEFDARLEIFRPADLGRWYRFQRVQGARWFDLADRDGIVLASRRWSGELVSRLDRPRPGWVVTRTSDGAVITRTD